MPLRLLEFTFGRDLAGGLEDLVGELRAGAAIDAWHDPTPADGCGLRVLLEARDVEEVVEMVSGRAGESGLRVVVLPVEATLPRPQEPSAEEETGAQEPAPTTPDRVSRDELYADLQEAIAGNRFFYIQVVLSTLVAAVGLLRDDVAVIIGAMVIAPLLGPNVALAFGATLGDLRFTRRALLVNLQGTGVAAAVAAAAGAVLSIDPTVPAIAGRTSPGLDDVVLALAAGVAGTLAFTSGLGMALIGVMVAVALLPPLVVAGMLAGAGLWPAALGALLLLATNVICVNLAGVATFVALGIRPRAWWDREGARRSSRLALLVWAALLLAVLVTLLLEAT